MCATYFIDDGTAAEMLEIINALNQKYGYETVTWDQVYPDGIPKAKDIYPKMAAPVGAAEQDKITISMPTWGFPRVGSKEVGFNARSENVQKYSMWKEAYETRRGFAPARGFYESKKLPEGKHERYYFEDPNGKLLFLAAILESVKTEVGEEHSVFTILTTQPNESVKAIHDRMPLLLEQDELYRWMTDEEFANHILSRVAPALVSVQKPITKENRDEQLTLFD